MNSLIIAWGGGHEALRLQEFNNELIETSGIFDAASVPGFGQDLVDSTGINDAVFLPAASELSYSPLMTNVGTFIDPSRGVMSVPPRARKIWPIDSPLSQGSLSTKVLRRYLPSFVSGKSAATSSCKCLM